MLDCPSCGRRYPEVAGAATQACPHCGHETASPTAPAFEGVPNERVDPVAAASHALAFLRRHYGRLLLVWAPVVAVGLATSFALGAYEASAGIPADPTLMTAGQSMRYLGVALPLALVASAASLAGWAFVAALALDREAPRPHARVGALLRSPGPLLAVAFLLTLTYLVGLILLVVPFLVFFHWYLFAPAAHADGRGVAASLDASRRFSRERQTAGFTALVLLAWLSVGIIGMLGGLVAGVVAEGAGLDPAPAVRVGSAIVGGLVAPIVPLLPASFWALASRAPAPPPAAASGYVPPAERFRTTKCPDCGTLVPYTATGAPVTVSCPVCGRSGRVL